MKIMHIMARGDGTFAVGMGCDFNNLLMVEGVKQKIAQDTAGGVMDKVLYAALLDKDGKEITGPRCTRVPIPGTQALRAAFVIPATLPDQSAYLSGAWIAARICNTSDNACAAITHRIPPEE